MSIDWVSDIEEMHTKYGFHKAVNNLSAEDKKKFLNFRLSFLKEELAEMEKAMQEDNKEEIVDALIDLCVVAIGTLDLFEVNPYTAWNEVFEANMNKNPGVKASRPNPLGLPDLIKPEGWVAPSHKNNIGTL
jgi:predicted HAD superfamily Cof-like phosphohydrolase